jgi:hypothetical protein
MTETRKIVAILPADVGFSRMASADKGHTLARRSPLEVQFNTLPFRGVASPVANTQVAVPLALPPVTCPRRASQRPYAPRERN